MPTVQESTQLPRTTCRDKLIDRVTLAGRWGVSIRTVTRYCQIHGIEEIRFVDGGKVLYRMGDLDRLERKLRILEGGKSGIN